MLAAVELWNLDGMCTDKYVVSKQLDSTSLEIVTAFTAQMLQILVAIICTVWFRLCFTFGNMHYLHYIIVSVQPSAPVPV